MKLLLASWLPVAALLISTVATRAPAAPPLSAETRLVAVNGAPAVSEHSFNIATPQDLVVTFTDLQTPAALSSANVVVTEGASAVGNLALAAPATTGSFTIVGAVGDYTLRVFGAPNGSFSVGTFTVCIAPKSAPTNCIQSASLSGNISAPSSAMDPTISTVSETLAVSSAGTYTVNFTDDMFPVPLSANGGAPNLAIFQGSTPVALAIASGTTVTLSPGTYTLLAIAQADPTVKAGLYGITIFGPVGVAPLLDKTYPVGAMGAPTAVNNSSAQNLSLAVTDFAFPASLGSASALATAGGTAVGMAATPGAPSNFAAPARALQLWSFAAAGSDAGTYEVNLQSSTVSLLDTAYGIANGGSQGYAYVMPALNAGIYQAVASDMVFPAALQSFKFAIAQNGTILQQSASATSLNFTAAAGRAVLLVDATAGAAGIGLFNASVRSGGAAAPVFDTTQWVSSSVSFESQVLTVTTAADLDVTLSDLMIPAPFQTLDGVATRGSAVLGKIISGGTFTFAATPGTYQLTFIATPAGTQQFGLYGAQITDTAPAITVSAAPTTVVAGKSTVLTWTTTDATSCTASSTDSASSFSGTEATGSGTATVVVNSSVTYTLTCTGAGGSSAKSVAVTAMAAPSGGGGGSLGLGLLILLAALAIRGVSGRARRAECKLRFVMRLEFVP